MIEPSDRPSHGPDSPFVDGPEFTLRTRAWQGLLRRGLSALAPGRLITRGPLESSEISLSFDDGPDPEQTPRVLDALAREGIAATFFLVGDRARRRPSIVRRIAREGHAIGNHSYSHPVPTPGSGRLEVLEAIRAGEILAEILGTATDLYRPPFGWITARGLRGLWREGFRVALWNVDPKDHALGSAEELRAEFRRRPPRGGDLVLLHDDRPLAGAVLPELARSARDRGLGFARLDSWLGPGPGRPPLATSGNF